MDPSDILTLSSPKTGLTSVESMPSPVLELAYAYYAIVRPESEKRGLELSWLQALKAKHPDLVLALQAFWKGENGAGESDLFLMACELGYARDDSIERFLSDFPRLPEQVQKHLEALTDQMVPQHHKSDGATQQQKMQEQFAQRLALLKKAELRKPFIKHIKQLWNWLEPLWTEKGLAETVRASQVFLAKFKETGSVLDALPPHHFTQFESSAQQIRTSQEKRRMLVTPLFFAHGGGFNFDFSEDHYIGYGIQSERMYEHLAAMVKQTSSKTKALADETRLMLLTLIARYDQFALTVSDFAVQLGVSQPTVSGHLKLLKEAGLVTLEKHGNKSLYKINTGAMEQALGELRELMRLP
jgi:DNA-binding transcriptional ArsR family regulator